MTKTVKFLESFGFFSPGETVNLIWWNATRSFQFVCVCINQNPHQTDLAFWKWVPLKRHLRTSIIFFKTVTPTITKSIVFSYKASWNFRSTVGISRFRRLLNHFSTKWAVQLHFLARPWISDCKKWNSVSNKMHSSLMFIYFVVHRSASYSCKVFIYTHYHAN